MKTTYKALAVALLAGGSMFAQTRFSIGVNVGSPRYTAPPAYAAVPYDQSYNDYVPPCPGPGYTWVDGYWNSGAHRTWVSGFWRAPAVSYGRSYVAPRYNDSYRFRVGDHDRDRHDRDDRHDRNDRDDRDDRGRGNSYNNHR